MTTYNDSSLSSPWWDSVFSTASATYSCIYQTLHSTLIGSTLSQNLNFSNINLDLTDDYLDSPNLFLNQVPEHKLFDLLSSLGIFSHLKSYGFPSLRTSTDTSDPFVHRIRISDQKIQKATSTSNFLLDIWLRKRINFKVTDLRHIKKEELAPSLYAYLSNHLKYRQMTLIVVEWICLQNPLASFSSRPQLPGQHYPGLRLGRKTERFLEEIAQHSQASGLICLPEHFHNAFLNFRKGWRFFNPAFEGWFLSLVECFSAELSGEGQLAYVAWAIELRLIKNRLNKEDVLLWVPQEQMFPLASCLKDYFASSEYLQLVETHKDQYKNQYSWFYDSTNPSLDFLKRDKMKKSFSEVMYETSP